MHILLTHLAPTIMPRRTVGGLLALLVLGHCAMAWAAAVTVEIRPQPVMVGEDAQLVLASATDYPEVEILDLPAVDGIEWLGGVLRSSQTSIINFQARQSFSVAYPFRATREGTITIPAFAVNLKRERVMTTPVTTQVATRRFLVGDGQDGQQRTATLEDLLFLRIQLPEERTEFMVGEEIPVTIKVYSMNGLMVEFPYPEISLAEGGAEIIFRDCSAVNDYSRIFTPYRQRNEQVGDDSFRVHHCQAWLRPVSAGRVDGVVALKVMINIPEQRDRRGRSGDPLFDSFFRSPFARYQRHEQTIYAELPQLQARPLPPPPGGADFLGLVGDWQIEVELPTEQVRAGEPFTLRIKAIGQGTTETMVAPKLEVPGCRLFPPEISRPGREEFDVRSQAEIRWAIIPLQAGPLPLHLRLATFDPVAGQYRETDWRRNLTVAPGDNVTGFLAVNGGGTEPGTAARPVRERADELLYLKRSAGGGVMLPLWRNRWPWLLLLVVAGPAIFGIAELLAWRRRRFAGDPALRRQLAARRRRGHVERRLRRTSPETVVAVVREEVVPYLADRLALPPGVSASELAAKVTDPELAAALRDAEAGAYLPGAASPETLRDKILRGLSRLGIILLMAGAGLFAETVAAGPTDNPFAAYDEQRFAAAAAVFGARLDPARPDPALLYNLGNCLYQQGDLTGALVCFEQARRLAPGDSDIRENLNHVRRRLMLPEIGRGGNPWQLAVEWRDHLRPDAWGLLAALAWGAAGLLLALRRRLADTVWQGLLGVLAVIILTAVLAMVAQLRQTYSHELAVVLERGAPIRMLPADSAREADYRLYPGEPVRIVETRDDGWRRIRGEGGEGWVRDDVVARLWPPARPSHHHSPDTAQ